MTKFIKTCFTVALIAAVAAALFIWGPAAVSRYRRAAAAAAEEEGRADRAIELLLPELDRNPKDLGLRMRLIELYIGQGNFSRAEYMLEHGMREQGGQAELYRLLCDVYVMQDKLLDAVSLLNNLPNPRIQEQLDAERPAPPVLTPPPGDYRELPSLTVWAGEGQRSFVTIDGKIPSVEKNLYTEPIQLPQGYVEVQAVSVGADGLVSDWAVGVYRVDDVRERVFFAEPAIETHARALIGIPEGEIVSGLLQNIAELIIPEAHGYKTLDDIKWFPGLRTLWLQGTGDTHTDISALAGLPDITSLRLSDMGIDSMDLDAVGALEYLEYLDLSHNQIATLGNLAHLTSLTYLALTGNSITDLTPLSGMTLMNDLDLGDNGIEETQPLSEMTLLTRLDMEGNRVRDLQGLSGMAELRSLNLSRNSIVSLEPLAGLQALTGLSLSHNKEMYRMELISVSDDGDDPEAEIEDGAPSEAEYYNTLTPLGRLTGLKTLLLDACGIGEIAPLAPLTGLERLSLNDNALTSLADVQGMTAMIELSANRNAITSLRPLQGMSKLQTLHIEYNGMPSLIAIRELPSLKTVYAFGNPLTERVTFVAPGVHVYG
ncbi:MAG: leucine-rich repeat domain-containing protein [Oscillospiraceae bacterium]|nr:leucine-rich repeat domain-containing protein [Oscillospiraceae bacterium]